MAERAQAHIEIVTADEMPGDRAAICVERQGRWVMCVREGEITPRLLGEINSLFAHITATGQWLQNWPEHHTEPQQQEAV